MTVSPLLASIHAVTRQGAAVLAMHGTAYKLFWGIGAASRCRQQLCATDNASRCAVWGQHVLPVRTTALAHVLRAKLGHLVAPGSEEDAGLRAFVDHQLEQAALGPELRAADHLMNLCLLRTALGDLSYGELIGPLKRGLHGLLLRVGPAHGDLHRRNIIAVDGSYFVIDCDRYSARSSPIFDRLHFALTERRLEQPSRWVELLCASQDLVEESMRADGNVQGSPGQVALAYGFSRVAFEANAARIRGRDTGEYKRLARTLLKTCGNWTTNSGATGGAS